MKIVIAGGTGALGSLLSRWFCSHDVVVLSRGGTPPCYARWVPWDGCTLGDWVAELEGADVLINLAGHSVDCRYSAPNRRAILDSRILSTKVLGQALSQTKQPPKIWLQMSTATIYAHTLEEPHDERGGILGGNEPDIPDTWRFSIDVAKSWEAAANQAPLGRTRLVLLRSSMIMSADGKGAFGVLADLARKGLGGPAGNGRQYMSWIHELDFCRAVEHLIECPALQGPVILAAPSPLPNRQFMETLRKAVRMPVGIPAPAWLIEIAAFFMRTESELLLKSRRVYPRKLLESGFTFKHAEWASACAELTKRRMDRGDAAGYTSRSLSKSAGA